MNEERNPITNLSAQDMERLLDQVKEARAKEAAERSKRVTPHFRAQTRKRVFEMASKKLRGLKRMKQTEQVQEAAFRLEQLLFDMRMGNR